MTDKMIMEVWEKPTLARPSGTLTVYGDNRVLYEGPPPQVTRERNLWMAIRRARIAEMKAIIKHLQIPTEGIALAGISAGEVIEMLHRQDGKDIFREMYQYDCELIAAIEAAYGTSDN